MRKLEPIILPCGWLSLALSIALSFGESLAAPRPWPIVYVRSVVPVGLETCRVDVGPTDIRVSNLGS
jgi:hypothetical protein